MGELQINGVEVVDQSTSCLPFKCYFETLLSNGLDAKTSHLKTELWAKDLPENCTRNETVPNDTTSGYITRKKRVEKSQEVQFIIEPHFDFLKCERLLIPGLNLKMRLIRSNDSFFMLAKKGKNYKVKIISLNLSVRKVTLSPTLFTSHMSKIENNLALYPFSQTKITTELLPAGITSKTIGSICNGVLPSQIYCCLVDTNAFSGDQSLNPYIMENGKLNYFVFKVVISLYIIHFINV